MSDHRPSRRPHRPRPFTPTFVPQATPEPEPAFDATSAVEAVRRAKLIRVWPKAHMPTSSLISMAPTPWAAVTILTVPPPL